jgi:hypothetical protein
MRHQPFPDVVEFIIGPAKAGPVWPARRQAPAGTGWLHPGYGTTA